MNRSHSKRSALGVGLVLCLAASSVLAQPPNAFVGAGRRLQGHPVANAAIHARFVFAIGDKVIVINEAREVWYHHFMARGNDRAGGAQIGPAIRMRGTTIGVANEGPRYALPWNRDIVILTPRGELYKHEVRGDNVMPPEAIPGAPVGTGGQEPKFMFMMGNQLVNVTINGEIWVHAITRTVAPGRRIGVYRTTGVPADVRHAFHVGRTVYLVGANNGGVIGYDMAGPALGNGRVVRAGTVDLGRADMRWIFPMETNRHLVAVNQAGEVWVHDIST
ncbi:MAG: hypothetical protein K8H88_29935, partial [Sandaracinaceae bacterium]|nr:hypothetical protein [Sandaracinaceae bacterium]